MQQFMRVDLAQTVEHADEHIADEAFGHLSAMTLDILVQGASPFELHHHVDRVVGAEKIQHPDHVRMQQPGERAAFLEKTLHAVAESGQILVRHLWLDLALLAQSERIG